ncbi:MAG: ATP-binding protein [Planctomycetales bacterium]
MSNPRVGGLSHLKHLLALPDESVSFRIEVDDLAWETELLLGGGIDGRSPERVTRSGQLLFERTAYAERLSFGDVDMFVGGNLAVRTVFDLTSDVLLEPLVKVFRGCRVYGDYHLRQLREHGSRNGPDLYLHSSGMNAFTVLRNWRDKRDLRPAYDFVIEGLQDAFPDFFEDFDFELAGQSVMLRLYLRGLSDSDALPHHLAPDGFLMALLHLCAVAGAEPGTILAIDEMENALHPFAIRQLLASFRNAAAKRKLTIILATHSPVLLDEFTSDPSRVFIMEPDLEVLPVALDQHRNPEWLSHFSLGKLYGNLDFGAPRGAVSAKGTP